MDINIEIPSNMKIESLSLHNKMVIKSRRISYSYNIIRLQTV